jgi:hypothetical protein
MPSWYGTQLKNRANFTFTLQCNVYSLNMIGTMNVKKSIKNEQMFYWHGRTKNLHSILLYVR